jgi:hypothetical protein
MECDQKPGIRPQRIHTWIILVGLKTKFKRAADRLKEIRIRRAEAIEDARAKGWQFIYGEGETDDRVRQRVYS